MFTTDDATGITINFTILYSTEGPFRIPCILRHTASNMLSLPLRGTVYLHALVSLKISLV